ncbi:MAG: glycoside hydrolase family 25 protein [Rhodospirillaceae bacterium]|nr:glycoside hydrolase family 25 protein [Rhodospirillaceae bacterium]
MLKISRRALIAGLSTLAIPGLLNCTKQEKPQILKTPIKQDFDLKEKPQPLKNTISPVMLSTGGLGLDVIIDMNHNSIVTDFSLMRNQSNILGIIHKASEGGDWLDPMYKARQIQAEASDLLWGAYHFGTHQYSGAQQATSFLTIVQPKLTTLMALDLEPNERNPRNTMDLAQAEDFVRTIYQATGRWPLVYTHPNWANGKIYGHSRLSLGKSIGNNSILAKCDLWLADYRVQPELPLAWTKKRWRFWQYAGDDHRGGGGPLGSLSRAVAGVNRCDRNMFLGDVATLYKYWNNEIDVV